MLSDWAAGQELVKVHRAAVFDQSMKLVTANPRLLLGRIYTCNSFTTVEMSLVLFVFFFFFNKASFSGLNSSNS